MIAQTLHIHFGKETVPATNSMSQVFFEDRHYVLWASPPMIKNYHKTHQNALKRNTNEDNMQISQGESTFHL